MSIQKEGWREKEVIGYLGKMSGGDSKKEEVVQVMRLMAVTSTAAVCHYI